MTILLQAQALQPKCLDPAAELSSRPEHSAVEGPAVSLRRTEVSGCTNET
jgi:hypothetical protein